MIEIQPTADGSSTLYVVEMDEHYHSVKGALTESAHVYVHYGLEYCAKSDVRLLEMGLGTGLNAWLSKRYADKHHTKVRYVALEKYPLKEDCLSHYISTFEIAEPELRLIHECCWNEWVDLSPYFSILKLNVDLLSYDIQGMFDVVYYDAFAPEKQPELWTKEVFLKISKAMCVGGVLTTYCAKGTVRRTLQSIGLAVERLQGPPGGKREVIRATKIMNR